MTQSRPVTSSLGVRSEAIPTRSAEPGTGAKFPGRYPYRLVWQLLGVIVSPGAEMQVA
jgi:hypothetical protein